MQKGKRVEGLFIESRKRKGVLGKIALLQPPSRSSPVKQRRGVWGVVVADSVVPGHGCGLEEGKERG